MDVLSDRGSTPLASTIHSHVQWDINKNRTKARFTAYVRLLFVQGRTAMDDDVSLFCNINIQSDGPKRGYGNTANSYRYVFLYSLSIIVFIMMCFLLFKNE